MNNLVDRREKDTAGTAVETGAAAGKAGAITCA